MPVGADAGMAPGVDNPPAEGTGGPACCDHLCDALTERPHLRLGRPELDGRFFLLGLGEQYNHVSNGIMPEGEAGNLELGGGRS